MNHEFIENPNKPQLCIECGYPEDKHGDFALCECGCGHTGNLQLSLAKDSNKVILVTRECLERIRQEIEVEINNPDSDRAKKFAEHQSPENQDKRLLEHNLIVKPYDRLIGEARRLDDQLHLSSDIFTAKTVPIEEIRRAIWANPEIPQDKKFFEFVSECKRHITHLQNVIFDLDKQKIEAYSEQKAWHIAMNDYANKLRLEERQQLKLNDINYDVKVPKPVTPRAIKTNPKKVTKDEMRKAVNELNSELVGTGKDGIQEYIVQMLMVSKNWTLEQTINHLRRTLKEGLSEVK